MFLLGCPAQDRDIVDIGSPAAVIVHFEQLIDIIGGTRLATNRSCLFGAEKGSKQLFKKTF